MAETFTKVFAHLDEEEKWILSQHPDISAVHTAGKSWGELALYREVKMALVTK